MGADASGTVVEHEGPVTDLHPDASLQPTEADVDVAVAAQSRLGETALRRAGPDEPACRTCRHFLDARADLAFCWHPVHRALVDAAWRCALHVPDADA